MAANALSEEIGTEIYAYSRPNMFRDSGRRSVQRYLEDVRAGKVKDAIGMHMHYSGSDIDDLIIIPGGRPADKTSRGYIIAVPYKNGFSPRK